MGRIKTFVLDTNVLLHSAQSIESFTDNDVVIPMTVIEELDKFKKNSDELGRNARSVIRKLDRLRQSESDPGKLSQGIPLSRVSKVATGKLYVLTSLLPPGAKETAAVDALFGGDMPSSVPDNRILRVAYELHTQGRYVIFISKDINVRLKADALGIRVMDFDERGTLAQDKYYTGLETKNVPAELIQRFFLEKALPMEGLLNSFVMLEAEGNSRLSAIGRIGADKQLHLLDPQKTDRVWNITPHNKEQRMAIDLLLDPEVKLVSLIGGAGTGKTLLALAAALQQTLNSGLYEKILVSRPIIPLGKDIGFLPGSKDAKLTGWMQPIFDNLDFLMGGAENVQQTKSKNSTRDSAASLVNSHKVDLEALTYIRGRSIARQFVIVDEAQNLTPHEIKTIVSRCGDGTKMVLTGDPGQIDNPYLDASSNGLSFAVERLKGQAVFGHITLAKSERSKLAALASKLL